MKTKKLKSIQGALITADIEIDSLNEQYGINYDGFVLEDQTARNTKSTLYGFHGLPANDTPVYPVETYYR